MSAQADRLSDLVADLGITRPLSIIDVGANPATSPVYEPLLEANLCEVIGFEPDRDAYAALEASCSDQVRYLPVAVGDGEMVDFYKYPESTMSSIFPLSRRSLKFLGHFRRHLGQEEIIQMKTCRLDKLKELKTLDVLKIDAQGAELGVLQNARKKLRRAVAVICEMRFYRLYEGEPMLYMLDEELREQGFVLHKFLHQKSRMLKHSQSERVNAQSMSSQLIDGDAVYIRSLEAPNRWKDEQLGMLALISAALLHSHDLALKCIDLLSERGVIAADTARRYVDRLPEEFRA